MYLLKNIIEIVIKKVLLINSIVLKVDLISQLNNILKLYIINIKIVIMLVIFCYFIY